MHASLNNNNNNVFGNMFESFTKFYEFNVKNKNHNLLDTIFFKLFHQNCNCEKINTLK